MTRRTMTIRRIDPWSAMKVGFLANLVLLGILLLAGRVVWFFIDRLELVTKACEVASSVGFQDCGLNGGNIFRNALLLGLLGVVVQTGIIVFVAFLFNLISELTGGLIVGVDDDGPATRVAPVAAPAGRDEGRAARAAQAAKATVAGPVPPVAAGLSPEEVARQAMARAEAARARAESETSAGAPAPAGDRPSSSSRPPLPQQELFRRPQDPPSGPQGPFRG